MSRNLRRVIFSTGRGIGDRVVTGGAVGLLWTGVRGHEEGTGASEMLGMGVGAMRDRHSLYFLFLSMSHFPPLCSFHCY